jgi:hypothetical protein
MKSLVQNFLAQLQGRQGCLARANGTFFSAQVVNTALQRIRLDMLDGAELTEQGHLFVQGAAAYLAWLSYGSMKKRGIAMRSHIQLDAEPLELSISAHRVRDGQEESYTQHLLSDVYELLLRPPHYFPALHGALYPLETLNMPTVEYLYLYGVYLMQSPRAEGNWPHGQQLGGLDEDLTASRHLLVDDLHRDAGLAPDDATLRALSWWLVFPPYGADMNEGQRYNMMTLVDQIAVHPTLPAADGIAYLQALLRCQMATIRFLAARTLLVLGIAPRTLEDTYIYQQALSAPDHAAATAAMEAAQWLLEDQDDTSPPEDWGSRCQQQWQQIMSHAPRPSWQSDAVFSMPEFQRLEALDPSDQQAAVDILTPLLDAMPEHWFIRCAMGTYLMPEINPLRGEALLRSCLRDAPEACIDAHSSLASRLKWQGKPQQAMQVLEAAVQHCPWQQEGVDACMWLLSDGLTYKVRGANT